MAEERVGMAEQELGARPEGLKGSPSSSFSPVRGNQTVRKDAIQMSCMLKTIGRMVGSCVEASWGPKLDLLQKWQR